MNSQKINRKASSAGSISIVYVDDYWLR